MGVEKIHDAVFGGVDGIVINCAAESMPEGWNSAWLEGCTNYKVNWGVTE